jgi:hypothetical protein
MDNFEIFYYDKPSFSPGGFGLSLSQLMRRDSNWPKFPSRNPFKTKNVSHKIFSRDFQKQVVKRLTSTKVLFLNKLSILSF